MPEGSIDEGEKSRQTPPCKLLAQTDQQTKENIMAKVLIVDDSPIVTKLIAATLTAQGFTVEVSNSSFGVSNKIREFQPQVLLMDLGLPGLSGDALLGIIKESGATCHTIIVSSAPEAEMQNHVRKGLANDYYIKGTSLNLLVDKIRPHVKKDPTPPPAASAPARQDSKSMVSQAETIPWQESLRIGFETIDSHHKEIFKRYNQLLQACSVGKGREEIAHFIKFLHDYINYHFAEEEAIQLKYSYPGYEEHHKEHERFSRDLVSLERLLAEEGAVLSLVIQTNKLSLNWLVHHISITDKALAEFLSKKGITG
jgi:hemerythrin